MKFWSIQDYDYFKSFEDKEFLENDFDKSEFPEFKEQYKWMKQQLNYRTGCKDDCMIWLWTKKPEPQKEWGFEEIGKTFVTLEIEIPRNKVLMSDYESWHMCLNNEPIELDGESIDKYKSWERVFDFKWLKKIWRRIYLFRHNTMCYWKDTNEKYQNNKNRRGEITNEK